MAEGVTYRKKDSLKCKECDLHYNNIDEYVDHLESKDHKKTLMKTQYGENFLLAKKLKTTVKDNPKLDEDSSSETGEENDVYRCETCESNSIGFRNYQLHLQGKKHSKNVYKAKLMKEMDEDKIQMKLADDQDSLGNKLFTKTLYASSSLVCKTCNKECSGPESYRQHLAGTTHKKKLAALEIDAKLAAMEIKELVQIPVDSATVVAVPPAYSKYCQVCQAPFSGPASAFAHFSSEKHAKKLSLLSQIKDIMKPTSGSDDEFDVI